MLQGDVTRCYREMLQGDVTRCYREMLQDVTVGCYKMLQDVTIRHPLIRYSRYPPSKPAERNSAKSIDSRLHRFRSKQIASIQENSRTFRPNYAVSGVSLSRNLTKCPKNSVSQFSLRGDDLGVCLRKPDFSACEGTRQLSAMFYYRPYQAVSVCDGCDWIRWDKVVAPGRPELLPTPAVTDVVNAHHPKPFTTNAKNILTI